MDIWAMEESFPFELRLQGSVVENSEERYDVEPFGKVKQTDRYNYTRVIFKLVSEHCEGDLRHFDPSGVNNVKSVKLNARNVRDASWVQRRPKMSCLKLLCRRLKSETAARPNVPRFHHDLMISAELFSLKLTM